jgi:hypothetical protein
MDTSSFNLASDYTVEQKIPHGLSFLAGKHNTLRNIFIQVYLQNQYQSIKV